VQFVQSNATSRDVVVVSPPYTLFPVQYYYSGNSKVLSMPIWDRTELLLPEATPERLKADSTYIQQGHRRIYLIVTLDLDEGHDVKQYLDHNYTKLDQVQFSKHLWVEVYQAEYPATDTYQAVRPEQQR
jgi:mannosyltransferase